MHVQSAHASTRTGMHASAHTSMHTSTHTSTTAWQTPSRTAGGRGRRSPHKPLRLPSGTRTRDRHTKGPASRRRGEGTGWWGAHTRCLNCGELGHVYRECARPLTSYGVILFRRVGKTSEDIEYLMICRRHTFGYTECIRAQFDITCRKYTRQLLSEMTVREREKIAELPFEQLWDDLWQSSVSKADEAATARAGASVESRSDTGAGSDHAASGETRASAGGAVRGTGDVCPATLQRATKTVNHWRHECELVRAKGRFETLRQSDMFQELLRDLPASVWETPEWGFPKGKRNRGESGWRCAKRELGEETGLWRREAYRILDREEGPAEEVFQGTDGRRYRHVYYIGRYEGGGKEGMREGDKEQEREVSRVEWVSYREGMGRIREYNKAKQEVLKSVHQWVTERYEWGRAAGKARMSMAGGMRQGGR